MDGAYCLIVFLCWFVLTGVDASCDQDYMQAKTSVEIRDNHAEIKLAFPNAAKCHASIKIACPSQCSNDSTTLFTCFCPKLNQMYNISATVLQDEPMAWKNYTVYTTDVQSVSAETIRGENASKVTCHFARGTKCKGCCLDWWLVEAPESTMHSYQNISRSHDSLEASGTIEGLDPQRTYMLMAYDIESNGMTSTEVGVILKGGLSLDNEEASDGDSASADDGDSNAIAASVLVIVLTCTCAVSAAVVVVATKRFKGRISIRQILEHRKQEQRRESNKKKKQNEEFDENYIPPIPPRTADMHILVFPENTQAYLGTGNNVCTTRTIATVECSTRSQDAMSMVHNTLHCKLQGNMQVHPDQNANPEVVSIHSAGTPPPLPPRTDSMLQPHRQSHKSMPDTVRSKENHFSWLKKLGIGRKGTPSGISCSTKYPPSGNVDRNMFNIEMKYNLAYQTSSEFLAT